MVQRGGGYGAVDQQRQAETNGVRHSSGLTDRQAGMELRLNDDTEGGGFTLKLV